MCDYKSFINIVKTNGYYLKNIDLHWKVMVIILLFTEKSKVFYLTASSIQYKPNVNPIFTFDKVAARLHSNQKLIVKGR